MTPRLPDTASPAPSINAGMSYTAFAPTETFRRAMRALPTGVAVITTRGDDGRFVGLTVNSIASLSLQPPLVTWALRIDSPLVGVFQSSRCFCVNVLSSAQTLLARQFASPVANRFDGVTSRLSEAGIPLLDGCSAWLECSMHADLGLGDHLLFVGAVRNAATAEQAPLGWYAGRYFEPEAAGR